MPGADLGGVLADDAGQQIPLGVIDAFRDAAQAVGLHQRLVEGIARGRVRAYLGAIGFEQGRGSDFARGIARVGGIGTIRPGGLHRAHLSIDVILFDLFPGEGIKAFRQIEIQGAIGGLGCAIVGVQAQE